MIDGGGKRHALLRKIEVLYLQLRHRRWIAYDHSDSFVLHVGTLKECLQVQEQSYGGITVIPLLKSK